MEFNPRMPVFIANIHRQHGFNLSRNKHTVATVLSVMDGRCMVKFKDNSIAIIGSQYLEVATESKHLDQASWRKSYEIVSELKAEELNKASKCLISLCNEYGVKLSVVGGEIVLMEK